MRVLTLDQMLTNAIPKSESGLYCPVCGKPAHEYKGKMLCEEMKELHEGQTDIVYCDYEETDELKPITTKKLIKIRLNEVSKLHQKLGFLKNDLELAEWAKDGDEHEIRGIGK